MEPFVERLIAEKDQLQERMQKLKEFMCTEKYETLSRENQALLAIQYDAMKTYHNILIRRIELNA